MCFVVYSILCHVGIYFTNVASELNISGIKSLKGAGVVYISTQLEFCIQLGITHASGKMEIIWSKSREGKRRCYEKNRKMGLFSLENVEYEESFNI